MIAGRVQTAKHFSHRYRDLEPNRPQTREITAKQTVIKLGETSKEYTDSFYIKEPFDADSPNVSFDSHLRKRCKSRELVQRSKKPEMAITRDSKEIDSSRPTDWRMLTRPNWR